MNLKFYLVKISSKEYLTYKERYFPALFLHRLFFNQYHNSEHIDEDTDLGDVFLIGNLITKITISQNRANAIVRDFKNPAIIIPLTLILTKESEIVELFSDIGMVLSEDLLSDFQRPFAKRLGVLVLAALAVQHGQIVERRRHCRMLHAQCLLANLRTWRK